MRLICESRSGILRSLIGGIVLALSLGDDGARGASLAELVGGGTLTAGDCTFFDWRISLLDATAGSPALSQVVVTPLVDSSTLPGVQFAFNGQFATTGIEAIDLQLTYRVAVHPGASTLNGQSLGLAAVQIAGSGLTYASLEIADLSGNDLGATIAIVDGGADIVDAVDAVGFAATPGLLARANLFLTGIAAGDAVNVSTVVQRFSQTGPRLFPGDFNMDGAVNGVDLLAWQRGQSPMPRSGADLADWRANYGVVSPVSILAAAVPEASSLVLLVTGTAALIVLRMSLNLPSSPAGPMLPATRP